VTKTEVRHGSIDQMSKEEVLKALDELKQSYQPLTHDADMTGGGNTGNRSKARERLLSVLEGDDVEEASVVEDNDECFS
jgi:ribosomal protein L29